jgi:hypothetical protein
MAVTSNTYPGNGSTVDFTVGFPYIKQADVKVYVDGVLKALATDYTFHTASIVRFIVAPPGASTVLIQRVTDSDAIQATFQPGSTIPAEDLNADFRQTLYVAQEVISNTLSDVVIAATVLAAETNAALALSTANGIAGTANTALSDASAAVSTANAASATANGIASTANNALTQASTANSNATSAVSTANAAAATAAAAAQNVSLGLRNLIINGSMLVSQRASSFNLAANGTAYTLDRWLCASYGGGANIQQVIVDRAARLRFTGGAGSTTSNVNQRIESWDIAHLAGQQVTLSFDVSNTLRTDLVVNLTYPNVADNYATFTAGPVANVTVNSTLTRYSVTFTLGAQAINGLQVTFTFANQTSGSFDLARVQLEAGPLATPFETLPLPVENTLCKRYFHYVPVNIWGIATGPLQITETGIPFPTRMRTVPFIGALQADPETGPTSLNNNAQSISRITSQWASPYVQAASAGQFYILGYRFPLDAEL